MTEAEVINSPDWPFLQNGSTTLFLKRPVLGAAIATMENIGYRSCFIDCASEPSMVADISRALLWREQFGYEPECLKLDAFNDALRGMPNADHPKVLLVLTSYDAFRERAQETAYAVLDLLECSARNALLFGYRLLTFVHTDNPQLHLDGLGGRHACWNSKEWLMADRGIGG